MTDKQPEALQLAASLLPICEALQYRQDGCYGVETIGPIRDAAATIRRQHALIAELVGALELYLGWCAAEEDHSKADFYQRMEMCRTSEAAARAVYANAKEQQ